MKKNTNFCAWLFALFCAVWLNALPMQVRGQVTLPNYDGFNYTAGETLQTQTGWTSINTGDDIAITANSLTYPNLPPATGNKISFAGAGIDTYKEFTTQSTGTAYASFLLNITSTAGVTSTTGGYFTGFIQAASTSIFGATVWAKVDGAGYQLGINSRTTAANTVFTTGTPLSLNTTYFVVISYTLNSNTGDDVVKLWLNPTLGLTTEPSVTLQATNTGGTDLSSVGRLLIRQDAVTTTPTIEMDELRIGNVWQDVTPFQAVGALASTTASLANFGSVNNGANSAMQTYTLNGTGVVAPIIVNAPANFQVSKDGNTFSNSLSVTAAEANVGQVISVRFSPTSNFNGVKSGSITHSGFSAILVAVTGTETGNFYTEPFNYGTSNAPSLVGLAGSTWTELNSGNTVAYNAVGSLSFSPFPTQAGKASFGADGKEHGRDFVDAGAVTAGTTVYYSAFIRINTAQSAGDYFLSMASSASSPTYYAQLHARANGTGFQLGIAKRVTGGLVSYSTQDLIFGKVYLAVVKYTFNGGAADDVCDLFLVEQGASVPATEPTAYATNTGTLADQTQPFKAVSIRQNTTTSSPTGEVDYIRFGSTWAEVTSVINPTLPTLNVSEAGLNFGTVNNGQNSTVQTYVLRGTNLTNAVTVTAPANFQVSSDGITFSSSITYTAGDLATPKTVSVRFLANSGTAGLKTDAITHSGFSGTVVEVRGTEATLTVAPNTLTNFGNVNNGAFSTSQNYALTAGSIANDITVTAPANFQVSKDNNTFGTVIIYTIADFTANATQTVHVRFAPTSGTNGAKSGNITHSGFSAVTVAVSGTETGNGILTNPNTLPTFGNVAEGDVSAIQTYSLTVANPSADFVITAPSNFQVSKNGTNFSSSVTILLAEQASALTISVRFVPTAGADGIKTGVITHAGFPFADVSVTGNKVTPNMVITGGVFDNFGSVANGNSSASQSYTLQVTNPSASGVTVVAPANFQVSKLMAGPYTQSITYTPAELASAVFVRVRFSPTSGINGVKTGNVMNNGVPNGGFPSIPLSVTGTETGNAVVPTLVASQTSLTFPSTNFNTVSATQTYTLTATNLVNSVWVIAPAYFEVSKDGTNFANDITYTDIELQTPKTVTVRFKPVSGINGVKTGNITHGGFANTVVAVSGTEAGNATTLVASPTSLTFGSINNGFNSATQTYTLTGVNISADVTVTAPANFQVSKDDVAANFGSTVVYTVANFTTSSTQTVYVRFKPTSGINGSKTGNITHSGFTNTNVALSGTEIGNSATLSASPTSLTFGSVNNGANSTAQTYTLTGANITANLTVNAPINFQVSKDNVDANFGSTAVYTVADFTTNATQTVYVRFKPTSGMNGTKTGNITHNGFANTNVAVSGTEAGNAATLSANPISLTFGSTNNGLNSTAQTYTLTSANLTGDVTVTAPANFQVSKDGTNFGTSIIYTVADFTTSSTQTVSVRFSPTSGINGSKTGNITHSGFANTNVAVSGTEAGNAATLSANPTSLTFGSTNNGANSTAQTYTLTGANITADVTVTAPTNFQVSKDGTNFSTSVIYTVANFTTSSTQTVSVRFAPTSGTNGSKTGNITHSGFAGTTVAVSGTEAGNVIVPTLSTNFSALTFSTPIGTNLVSSTQTYTLIATGTLTANVTVTAPPHFEISRDGSTFLTNFTYSPAELTTSKTITVRFKPTSGVAGAKTGNITHTTTGATTINVAVTGTEDPALAVERWANDFKIAPNPASDALRLTCDLPTMWIGSRISLSDMAGKEFISLKWENPLQPLALDVAKLQRGMYILRIQAEKREFVQKVVLR